MTNGNRVVNERCGKICTINTFAPHVVQQADGRALTSRHRFRAEHREPQQSSQDQEPSLGAQQSGNLTYVMVPISGACWSARDQDTAEFSSRNDNEKTRCPEINHQIKRRYHAVQLRLPWLVGCVDNTHLEPATLSGCICVCPVVCTYSTCEFLGSNAVVVR